MDENTNEQTESPIPIKRKGFIGELWDFMKVRKKFWLAPIIIVLLLLGTLMVVGASAGALSPFVYMM